MSDLTVETTEQVNEGNTFHGSEKYYMERIDLNLDRVLSAFGNLLNLETEAMVMLRDLRRERDNDRIDQAEKDFTFLMYDLVKYTHSPEFIKDYTSRLEVPQLTILGTTLELVLNAVTNEIKKRADNMVATLKAMAEDAKKG